MRKQPTEVFEIINKNTKESVGIFFPSQKMAESYVDRYSINCDEFTFRKITIGTVYSSFEELESYNPDQKLRRLNNKIRSLEHEDMLPFSITFKSLKDNSTRTINEMKLTDMKSLVTILDRAYGKASFEHGKVVAVVDDKYKVALEIYQYIELSDYVKGIEKEIKKVTQDRDDFQKELWQKRNHQLDEDENY